MLRSSQASALFLLTTCATPGKTFERCAQLIEEAGGEAIGSVQIHDRLESLIDLGVPNISLAEYKAPANCAADACPQCEAGTPITSF